MCNNPVEIDMSVDELLIVSNEQTINDQIIDKIELNENNEIKSTIDNVKLDQQVNQENSIELNKEINLNEERTNENEISKNKSINNHNKKEQISSNVQQILDQINQDKNLKLKQNDNQQIIQENNDQQIIQENNNQQIKLNNKQNLITKTMDIEKSQNNSLNESIKLTNEIEMNADESSLHIKIINLTNKSIDMNADESSLIIKPINLTNKSIDMSIDNDSLVLNDIRHIFDTSASSNEFLIPKPIKKTPIKKIKFNNNKENKMDISYSDNNNDNNDSLILKDIKIENNSTDFQENSPYLKSLPSPKPIFKLSRKRLNCETESPIKKLPFINNLFKNQFQQQTPVISTNKKWRSATYNPMTSSPKKMDLISPLKIIDNNILNSNKLCSNINNTIDNLFSNLDMVIQKSDNQPNLMGDYTSTYALPLISGRHKDLKTISPETLANLMNGEYSKSIGCFTIIDSRYPYEYEGGHIDGSKNIYTKDEINKYFFGTDKPSLITSKLLIKTTIDNNSKQSSSNLMQRNLINNQIKMNTKFNYLKRLSVIKEGCCPKNDENKQTLIKLKTDNELNNCINDNTQQIKRHAIIFHCEFSSERAPSLCRYLRKIDRELNETCYPNLYYPEVYLLHGGYKLFYEKFKNLCYPQTYLPMHSSDHKQDLIKFRTKSKSWSGDRKWKSITK